MPTALTINVTIAILDVRLAPVHLSMNVKLAKMQFLPMEQLYPTTST